MATASTAARCLLALDAAGAACSAALWREGEIRARRFEAMTRGQSERLVPMIEAVMTDAAVSYDALDAVAVTVGPGGFTGVRIGLATARALGLACARPVIGVTCFEAIAAAVPADERAGRTLAVLLDAKRAEVHVQAFGPDLAPLTEPASLLPEALDAALPAGPLTLAGDGAGQGRPALVAANRALTLASCAGLVDAARVAEIAAARALPAPDAAPPQPLYLRAPDATPSSRGHRT